MKKLKKIPTFKSEDEERDFWATHDSTEYIDWSQALHGPLFPNLKPSTKTISLRLPQWLLDELRRQANWRDVPYQSYMKQVLADHIGKRRVRKKRRADHPHLPGSTLRVYDSPPEGVDRV